MSMRRMAVGLAALLAVAFWGPAMAESETERIQESEQPGSEIEIDVEDGRTQIHRKDGEPLMGFDGGGETEILNPSNDLIELELPAGPTTIPDIDPIDDELPGEGPENLSGPFDEDPLPE